MTLRFIVGSVLLFAASAAVSVSYAASSRKRIADTDALIDLVRHIRVHIEYFLTPLDRIYSDFSSDALGSCGFSEVLKKRGLTEAIRSGKANTSKKTSEILLKFSESLGEGYRNDQLDLCDLCISSLTEQLSHEREEYAKKSDLYRFVPGLLAVFIILCFL